MTRKTKWNKKLWRSFRGPRLRRPRLYTGLKSSFFFPPLRSVTAGRKYKGKHFFLKQKGWFSLVFVSLRYSSAISWDSVRRQKVVQTKVLTYMWPHVLVLERKHNVTTEWQTRFNWAVRSRQSGSGCQLKKKYKIYNNKNELNQGNNDESKEQRIIKSLHYESKQSCSWLSDIKIRKWFFGNQTHYRSRFTDIFKYWTQ